MFRSIRGSLQAWHAAILATVLAVFGFVVYHLQRQATFQQIDAELHRTAELVAAGLRRPPTNRVRQRDGQRPDQSRSQNELASTAGPRAPIEALRPSEQRLSTPAANEAAPRRAGGPQVDAAAVARRDERPEPRLELSNELLELFDGETETHYYFVIWRGEDRILHKSLYAQDVPLPVVKNERGDPPIRTVRQRGEFREAILEYWFGTNILVGRSLDNDFAALHRTGLLLVMSGVGVLVAGLVGGRWISGRAIQPIATISATAAEISASNLSRRIDVQETESELNSLAQTLNQMFDRLETGFEQQIRFTADASHELRTPVAVILTNAELALSRNRPPEELRETIEVCRRSAIRMRGLVEALLTLARFDSGELRLEKRSFDLSHVAAECVALLRPLAERRRILIRAELPSTIVSADSDRVTQVLTNLLSNAIRYNRDGGRVDIRIRSTESQVIVTIADNGIGIAPDHLPHIFERFYRIDKARSREEGGTGLGLAICKSIVDAHGGEISVTSDGSTGATFEFRLPKRPVDVPLKV
ncbi:MAG: sensor histidine kinase [Planctomycetaceae bacterium]